MNRSLISATKMENSSPTFYIWAIFSDPAAIKWKERFSPLKKDSEILLQILSHFLNGPMGIC